MRTGKTLPLLTLACWAWSGCSRDEALTETANDTGLPAASRAVSDMAESSSSTARAPSEAETTSSAPAPASATPSSRGDGETSMPPSSPSSAEAGSTEPESAGDQGAISALEEYLGQPWDARPPLAEQPFASVALSAPQAEQAQKLLWEDHVATVQRDRKTEHTQRAIRLGDFTLRYDYTVFGDPGERGRSLYISLHGGGEAEASVNDDQWENQKVLYQPDEGIYLSPRAPTDTWNMWHQDHIDPLFARLIQNFVVLEGVDPNRVYVMGYSAGGDGVYQLGPRMADHWAAASAMAGHPNEAQPFSLRNIGFTIHVGAEDTAFDRNLIAVEWRDKLDTLEAEDPEGYPHVVEVHAGKAHWMDLEDAVAVPWMAQFVRNPTPNRIVWYQDDITHDRFYWLHDTTPLKETTIAATLAGQEIDLESDTVRHLGIRLRDDMLDLDEPVTVRADGRVVFEGSVPRTIGTLHATLSERGDPELLFPAEVSVEW